MSALKSEALKRVKLHGPNLIPLLPPDQQAALNWQDPRGESAGAPRVVRRFSH